MDRKFLAAAITVSIASLVVFHYITAYLVQSHPRTIAFVTRVIDGDTLEVSTGERIRLLGINTPETGQYYHDEAREALRFLVENKTIEMEKDSVSRDKYSRLLRYVFVGNKFVNLGIVRNGYAHSYIIPPNTRYSDEFRKAQKHAEGNQLGIWKHSDYFGCVKLSGFNYSDDNEFLRLRNDCGQISLGGWTVADESSSHVYKFRNIHFADEIVLHSSLGKDNATDIFWNSKTPIWNNAGDTIFLRDDRGLLALSHSYS